jgi:single-strand DNA-binding protein
MYLNKAIIAGNLTRDPEQRALPSGISVCQFSIATNRYYKDKDGNAQEATDYHNVVVFGRQAETSAQYLKKGQNVLVEGRIQTRSWDDKQSGEKKYRTEIVADKVQFGSKGSEGAGGGSAPAAAPSKSDGNGGQSGPDDSGNQIEYPDDEINPEDIPF